MIIQFSLVPVVLLMLQNLGINVTALVTGLGIGGIAVALAAQNILGDLLASLSGPHDASTTAAVAHALLSLVDQLELMLTTEASAVAP